MRLQADSSQGWGDLPPVLALEQALQVFSSVYTYCQQVLPVPVEYLDHPALLLHCHASCVPLLKFHLQIHCLNPEEHYIYLYSFISSLLISFLISSNLLLQKNTLILYHKNNFAAIFRRDFLQLSCIYQTLHPFSRNETAIT